MVVANKYRLAEEGSIVATVELKKKVVLQSLRQTKASYPLAASCCVLHGKHGLSRPSICF